MPSDTRLGPVQRQACPAAASAGPALPPPAAAARRRRVSPTSQPTHPGYPPPPAAPPISLPLQAARDLVRSINVTADVIEVSLANCECDDLEGHTQDGKALPGAANHVEQPGWDRLMGINSFSIERALQVRCWVAIWRRGWAGWAAAGRQGHAPPLAPLPLSTPAQTYPCMLCCLLHPHFTASSPALVSQPPSVSPQVDPYFMDSDSENEDNGSEDGSPSPSKQQPEAEQQQQQQQGGGLPAINAAQVAANLAAPGKGTKRGREEEGGAAGPSGAAAGVGECGTHPGPCNDACQSLEADEQLLKQKQMQVRAGQARGCGWLVRMCAAAVPGGRVRKRVCACQTGLSCSAALPLPCMSTHCPLLVPMRAGGSPGSSGGGAAAAQAAAQEAA